MPVKPLFLAALLLVQLGPFTAGAEDLVRNEIVAENPDPSPSLELLEFLGEWETDEGQWIDPAEMEHIQLPDQEQKDETENP